ncbi:DUF2271 domain-containing protein [Zunongwangia sp. HRR-M8]|uniref:DUF2271 domain-containing protein n=1 Tax=Zunongwangia sp. HRR-M8 TaxID=3015170 RepID=UPI0022DDE717|nr:DUF2271 domain-containing protein [Zunongwangia sp. HRR-M8]WBL22821.1 DUF2271 domain-containing protein [Zunongwangia sp. HRR-M8]
MKFNTLKLGLLVLCLGLFSFVSSESTSFKCLIQLTNYNGEGAYVVVSLINPSGEYEKTLLVQGDDEEWYPDLTDWWEDQKQKDENIDAISGATVGAGGRGMGAFQIESDKIDSGYKIRFETAVEDQKYYVKDLELPLTSENLKGKFEGKGYIRYVRIMASK